MRGRNWTQLGQPCHMTLDMTWRLDCSVLVSVLFKKRSFKVNPAVDLGPDACFT